LSAEAAEADFGRRRADTDFVPIDDDSHELAIEVRYRLKSGAPLSEVGRWLYLGPAAGRPTTAVKALVFGSNLGLAECTGIIDGVIAEVDPERAQQNLELRLEFIKLMDEWADEQRADEQSS
jgi:hypothetical protein